MHASLTIHVVFTFFRQGFGKFYETKGRPKAEKAEKPKTEGPKEGPKDTKTTRHFFAWLRADKWRFQFRKKSVRGFWVYFLIYGEVLDSEKKAEGVDSKNIYSEQTPAIFIFSIWWHDICIKMWHCPFTFKSFRNDIIIISFRTVYANKCVRFN